MAEQHADSEPVRYTEADKPLALRISDKMRAFVDWMGRAGSWLILPLVLFCVL